jgi:hypothetical protein
MAEYKSKYLELGFYVKGERKAFINGSYKTENKAEIAALDELTDAVRVDEPKIEAPTSKPKSKPKK